MQSHQKAAEAIKSGKFKDEIVPFTVVVDELDENGRVRRKEVVFETDEGVRYDASMEGFAKLKPVFHVKGTVTAGNASQMSDGAAALSLCGGKVGVWLKPLRFRSTHVGLLAEKKWDIVLFMQFRRL